MQNAYRKKVTTVITCTDNKMNSIPDNLKLNKDGSIQITNGISGNISCSIGADLNSTNQSTTFMQVSSGNSNSWNRILGNEYQLFVNDPDTLTYGFIIIAGGSYTYKGQGKLWDNNKNIYTEEDDLNLSTPGFIVVKAFRSDVNVNLSGGAKHTYLVNQNQFVRFNRPEGSYVLTFLDPKGQEKKYLLTSGRSYYIYNCGSCIDKDSNVVLPLFKEDSNALATYADDSLNSLLVSSGCMVKIGGFSNQVSMHKNFSYNNSTVIMGGGSFYHHQSSSCSSSESYISNTNYSGGLIAGSVTGWSSSSSSHFSSHHHSSSTNSYVQINSW